VDDQGSERALWLAAYVALVLAPLALVAAFPGTASFGTVVAAALGFAGLTVLALQAVMPSRTRVFTAPFGLDLLLRFHRQVGAIALALVAGHVVVLIADDPDRIDTLDAPDAGVAAVVALLVLAATAQWRLPYGWWRGLHMLLGVSVLALALVHVVSISNHVSTGTVRWALLLLVVAAAGTAFYLRAARPFAAAALPYRVRAVREERGGATTLELEADGHDGTPFAPGQFARIRLARAPYWFAEQPFRFASSAEHPEAPSFTIDALGTRVDELEPGTPVLLDGPHGSFQPVLPDSGYVLICGGIGIAPAMCLLRTLADRGDRRPVRLVAISRDWEEVTFREELAELETVLRLRSCHVLASPPADWNGERGPVDAALLRRVLPADAAQRNVLVCGPPEMIAETLAALVAIGIPPRHVHVDDLSGV